MTLTIFLIFTIGITTDFVNWNTLSNGFASTNELARSFLASVIVILDVLVVMQVDRISQFKTFKSNALMITDRSIQDPVKYLRWSFF